MKLNKFLWNNYKETEQGKLTIKLFTNGDTVELLTKYLGTFQLDATNTANFIDEINHFSVSPIIPTELGIKSAEQLFNEIVEKGFSLKYEGEEELENYKPDNSDFLNLIPVISTWLFYKFPDFFKPYFFKV